MVPDPKLESAIAQLCPSCGMCCNGVLFADVRLQASDDLKKLAAVGLRLEPHGNKMRFIQPCPAFDGKLCRIYENRPSRCHAFECSLLKKVHHGITAPHEALRVIKQMRKEAEKILQLLEALGNCDTTEPLSRRYEMVISQPWDLGGEPALLKLRSELPKAMSRLMLMAQEEFLT
jgi:Fe-S-cluster containining protein